MWTKFVRKNRLLCGKMNFSKIQNIFHKCEKSHNSSQMETKIVSLLKKEISQNMVRTFFLETKNFFCLTKISIVKPYKKLFFSNVRLAEIFNPNDRTNNFKTFSKSNYGLKMPENDRKKSKKIDFYPKNHSF